MTSKLNSLPSDLKAIADEMMEAKFPSPKVAPATQNSSSAYIVPPESWMVRVIFRGMHSGQRIQAVVSRRDIMQHGTFSAFRELRRDVERKYHEPMELLETDYEQNIQDRNAIMRDMLRTDIMMPQDLARALNLNLGSLDGRH